MLTIRLSRVGKKRQPSYRIVIQEQRRDPWGRALEVLGHYNPRTSPATLTLQEDRIRHWIAQGAQVSDTLWNLLVDRGVVSELKRRIVHISRKKRAASAATATTPTAA